MTDIYTEVGGINIGGFYMSWPFAQITVTPSVIEIKIRGLISTTETITIKKEEIDNIIRKKSLFGSGIKIEHHNTFASPHLVYASFTFKKLRNALLKMGYSIAEKK